MADDYTILRDNDEMSVSRRVLNPVSSILTVISGLGSDPETPRGMSLASQEQRSKIASVMCVICFEDLNAEDGDIYTVPKCQHRFHEDCVRRWKREKAACPFCRGPLPEELGETKTSEDLDNEMDYIVRRLQELITEMESNQMSQRLSWKGVLLNYLLFPLGILLPPVLLVMLWMAETITFSVGIVIFPFYVLSIIKSEASFPNTCKNFAIAFLMFITYPIIVLAGVLFFISFQILYSLNLAGKFYTDVMFCHRQWSDAYRVVVQGTLRFLQIRIESLLS